MIQNVFTLPIYVHQATKLEKAKIVWDIEKKWDEITQDDFTPPVRWGDKIQSNIGSRLNSIKDFKLKSLEKFITTHASEYYKQCQPSLNRKIFMNQSWININLKDHEQSFHTHSDSVISGVFHYKTNTSDGDLVLKNPIPFASCGLFPSTIVPGGLCKETIGIAPQECQLVLFPGWLEHRVVKNTTDHERISIAFNYITDNTIDE